MTDAEDPLALTDWLEEQKERAEERMLDDELEPTRQAEWTGEYRFIRSLQHYIEHDILELK